MKSALFAIVAVGLAFAMPAAAASFNCQKATRPVDKLICADPTLSNDDSTLDIAYRGQLKLNPAKANALRDAQRAWLTARDAKCPASSSAAASCMDAEYQSRIAAIRSFGNVTVLPNAIAALADAALTKTWPDKRGEIAFESGRFSPDGNYFVFSVSQVDSGDPEQAWLYDMRARKLVAVTEAPVHGKVGFTIDGLAFGRNGALYMSGERIDWQNQGNNRKLMVVATMAHAGEVKAFPKDADAEFKAQAEPSEDDNYTVTWDGDAFDVIAQNHGHGSFSLSARDNKTGKARDVAQGGAELEHILFDRHATLRFADGDAITSVDLAAGTARRLVVSGKTAVGQLLDQARSGRIIAYTRPGSCDPAKAGDGRTQFVCFLTVP